MVFLDRDAPVADVHSPCTGRQVIRINALSSPYLIISSTLIYLSTLICSQGAKAGSGEILCPSQFRPGN